MNENLLDPAKVSAAFKEYEAERIKQPLPEKVAGGLADMDKINDALQEFEAKSKLEDMSRQKEIKKDNTPKMIKATVKLSGGAIKDEKQAGWVLFGLALAMLALSFYLFFSRNVSINKLPTNYTPNPDMSHVSS